VVGRVWWAGCGGPVGVGRMWWGRLWAVRTLRFEGKGVEEVELEDGDLGAQRQVGHVRIFRAEFGRDLSARPVGNNVSRGRDGRTEGRKEKGKGHKGREA
jgi:hypothetical protein